MFVPLSPDRQRSRVAIVFRGVALAGGIETYLQGLIPHLGAAGCEVGFWSERDEGGEARRISLPDGVTSWAASRMGKAAALDALRAWHPDVIYSHGLPTPALERAITGIAPSVYFAHAYHGTCISESKCWRLPRVVPCRARLGPRCLVRFYPHRCGGLNPLTLLKDYAKQRARLRTLRRYGAILTFSDHMTDEMKRHGLATVYKVPFVPADERPSGPERARHVSGVPWRLLFAGRMHALKGGAMMLEALSEAARRLATPLEITFAGEGAERERWQTTAAALARENHALTFHFRPWLEGAARDALFDGADLLVVPSVWPEPFGLVGIDAGRRGVPAAAFAVGGIPEWLRDGKNGFLADASPPRAASLSDAIVKCLESPERHAALSAGAREIALAARWKTHVDAILDRFRAAVGESKKN